MISHLASRITDIMSSDQVYIPGVKNRGVNIIAKSQLKILQVPQHLFFRNQDWKGQKKRMQITSQTEYARLSRSMIP